MPNKYGIPAQKELADGFAKRSGWFYNPTLALANLYIGGWVIEAALNPNVSFSPNFGATGSRAEKYSSFLPHESGLGLGIGLAISSLLGYNRKNIFGTVIGTAASSISEFERFGTDPSYTPGQFLLSIGIRAAINVGDYLASYSLREWKDKRLETLVRATPRSAP